MRLYLRTANADPSSHTQAGRPMPLLRGVVAIFATLFTLVLAVPAHATCGNLGGLAMPALKGSVQLPAEGSPQLRSDVMLPFNASSSPIVGLWHVIYTTSAGALFNNTFDTWHSDGTEFENAFLPIVAGNICEGVWKETGKNSVKLYHVGWVYGFPGVAAPDPNDPASYYFVLTETITVSKDGNSYNGNFTFRLYKVIDNSYTGVEVDGTMAAARITVN